MTRAPFAADPALSRGREFPMEGALARGPRSDYQRDRDRIIHSIAFRRLAGKTQVFIAPDGDHFRVRLTHSLEVAQVGRVLARVLGLDEDTVNIAGSGCSIGHPIAASGARMLCTTINDLKRAGGGLGVAAMCAGGGQGGAVLIEV